MKLVILVASIFSDSAFAPNKAFVRPSTAVMNMPGMDTKIAGNLIVRKWDLPVSSDFELYLTDELPVS